MLYPWQRLSVMVGALPCWHVKPFSMLKEEVLGGTGQVAPHSEYFLLLQGTWVSFQTPALGGYNTFNSGHLMYSFGLHGHSHTYGILACIHTYK